MIIDYLALIPARGGSKAIPMKNLADLAGKPLLHYTIKAAKESINHIVVSSDHDEILHYSKQQGLDFDYKRPLEIAQDNTHRNEVVEDIIDYYKTQGNEIKNIVYLQPTSPFRTASDIILAIKQFEQVKVPVVGVNECIEHPYECISEDKDGNKDLLFNYQEIGMRQSYDKDWFFDNGSLYIFSVEHFLKNKNFFNIEDVSLFKMKKINCIDINDQEDLELAEMLMKSINE